MVSAAQTRPAGSLLWRNSALFRFALIANIVIGILRFDPAFCSPVNLFHWLHRPFVELVVSPPSGPAIALEISFASLPISNAPPALQLLGFHAVQAKFDFRALFAITFFAVTTNTTQQLILIIRKASMSYEFSDNSFPIAA
jgi:hypothetical protein